MQVPEMPTMGGKTNISLSLVFHILVICGLALVAAREGILGEKLKEIAVTIVPKKEKPVEETKKEQPVEEVKKTTEEKKVVEEAKKEPEPEVVKPKVETPKSAMPTVKAPPVVVASAPPPAAIPPTFVFSDGSSRSLQTGDPVTAYKSLVEYTLHSSWSYPRDLGERGIECEVEVGVDKQGRIKVQNWKKLSGNKEWDKSVQKVFESVQTIRKEPPTGFPKSVIVRFDLVSRDLASLR